MSYSEMLEEITAFIVGISPGHRGTDRTNHWAWVSGMLGVAVLHQAVLIQVRFSAVRAEECVAVWHWAGCFRLVLLNALQAFLYVVLIFSATSSVIFHLGQHNLFSTSFAGFG